MYTISKQFEFSASHQLRGLPKDHPCSRLHGHNYIVTLFLQDERLDENGMVMDYGQLASFQRYLKDHLDHRHLNDVMEANPTAENLARLLYLVVHAWWRQVIRVQVQETPKTAAVFEPSAEDTSVGG